MHEPRIKHLEGELSEMRVKGKVGFARAAYVSATGYRMVEVQVFVKRIQKRRAAKSKRP